MLTENKKKIRAYVIGIAIPLAVGALAALLTMQQMRAYESLRQPPLAPPGWLFPVVWTILYTLMGISSTRIYLSESPTRRDALLVYALQLFLNFGWTILYFGFGLRFAAFIWLVVLAGVIVVMLSLFYAIDRKSGLLQLPYLLWTLFACYLNLGVVLLNQ